MNKNKIVIILNILFLCFVVHLSYGQGDRYTGSYQKSSAIQYVNKSNFTIEGLEISESSKDCITLLNCENVTIKNCKIGPSPVSKGIYLYNCKNITIVDCSFENVQSGLVASTSQGIKFEYNDIKNVVGPLKGGYEIGVMAQFIHVSGPNNSISYNVCENIFGESSPEDNINLYGSNGTEQSPIIVKGNWIRGGGPSITGGGINLGDLGGSYQIAEDNVVVNGGQYGIGISGGHNMTLKNNKVFGSKNYFTNVGITACNWYENLGNSYNITIADNQVNYIHKDGYVNNWWFAQNIGSISGRETNIYKRDLSASILPEQIIGRARTALSANPDSSSTAKPGNDVEQSSDISIYKDKFDRICTNCKGSISSSATISVSQENGQEILKIPVMGYHTVIDDKLLSGTYYVKVENGDKLRLKQIIIK